MKFNFLRGVVDMFFRAESQRDAIEIICINHRQQIYLLPVLNQPLRHFKGHLPAHAKSAEIVRAFRLQLPNLFQVSSGHFLDGLEIKFASVQALRLQCIEWVVGSHQAPQFPEHQHIAPSPMDHEQRRATSGGADRHKRFPIVLSGAAGQFFRQHSRRGSFV